jgi:hypothetical protein
MATVKFDLAVLTKAAEEVARHDERMRQLKIAQERYRDSVEQRARQRFRDPEEIERYLNE